MRAPHDFRMNMVLCALRTHVSTLPVSTTLLACGACRHGLENPVRTARRWPVCLPEYGESISASFSETPTGVFHMRTEAWGRQKNQDRTIRNKDEFMLNKDRFMLKKDKFMLNKDKFMLNKDTFMLKKDKFMLENPGLEKLRINLSLGSIGLILRTRRFERNNVNSKICQENKHNSVFNILETEAVSLGFPKA